ncbi:hypothetical protein QBC41DRAFT_128249 [Cercophora samala]|uniref:Transmembrane protein n=1 Tax=Cercophora samala TaxID=330535 RepID=A0AA39ZBZ9_9PEZI|nr:hypothetical protein QBC41DRAFT_128249 [Cercophora samala]
MIRTLHRFYTHMFFLWSRQLVLVGRRGELVVRVCARREGKEREEVGNIFGLFLDSSLFDTHSHTWRPRYKNQRNVSRFFSILSVLSFVCFYYYIILTGKKRGDQGSKGKGGEKQSVEGWAGLNPASCVRERERERDTSTYDNFSFGHQSFFLFPVSLRCVLPVLERCLVFFLFSFVSVRREIQKHHRPCKLGSSARGKLMQNVYLW